MFYVLRHGQTDWNKNLRLQGSTDIPLNDTGREQARRAGAFLAPLGVSKIVCSPLSRALETAQIVAEALNITPQIDPRLTERNFGLFEGMTIDQVEKHRAEMRPHMNQTADIDGRHYPDNAEPLREVFDRVCASVEEHRTGGGCLFVLHGIPFRAISHRYTGEMLSSPNCAPVRIEQDGEGWRMIALDPDNPPIPQSHNPATTMGGLRWV